MDITKELVQMIEERIIGGRFLTTAALFLGLLAVIAGSCVFLWVHVALPVYTVIATAITKGVITRSDFFRFLFSMGIGGGMFWLLEWMLKGSRSMMLGVLDNSKSILQANTEVLALAQDANIKTLEALEMIRRLEARVESLENH